MLILASCFLHLQYICKLSRVQSVMEDSEEVQNSLHIHMYKMKAVLS